MTEVSKSIFETLNAINVNEHTEKKQGLTYLSWAWAWRTVKELYPDSFKTVYEADNGLPYWTDGRTAWVKVSYTINGKEEIEHFPILDYRNRAIPVDKVTSFDWNTAIQRGVTKCIARHGLGLYIYAGEDLPETEQETDDTDFIQLFHTLRRAFEDIGVDMHSENFQTYCKEKLKIESLDPAFISQQENRDAIMKRLQAVYNAKKQAMENNEQSQN